MLLVGRGISGVMVVTYGGTLKIVFDTEDSSAALVRPSGYDLVVRQFSSWCVHQGGSPLSARPGVTSPPEVFTGSVHRHDDRVLVTVTGDIDVYNLSLFTDLMAQAVAFQGQSVTVDVGGLTFLDSQALEVFVNTAEQVRLSGAKLDVRGATPTVYAVFKDLGLLDSLRVAAPPPAPLALAAMIAALSTFPRTREVLDAALQLIVGMAQSMVVGADGASLTVPRNGKLGTVAASNDTVLEMDHDQYDTGEGPCLDAALQGRRFHIDTLNAETRWPSFVPRARARGINSILSTPVTARGVPLGALNLYSRAAGVFTAQDNNWANVFADQIAVILAAAEDSTSPTLQEQVTDALLSREVIALAQGIVMHRDGVSPDAAHAALRALSRTTNTPMRTLSEQLVALHRDPHPGSHAVSPTGPDDARGDQQ
jgi:anti-anti-sigma factor